MASEVNNKIRDKKEAKRTLHPNSLKNLRPAKKGEVRNPKGRPKNGLSITAEQRRMLPLPCPYALGKTWCQWLADRGMALAGENPTYYKELMDRLEGKLSQPTEGEVKTHVTIEVRYVNRDHDRGGVTSSVFSSN